MFKYLENQKQLKNKKNTDTKQVRIFEKIDIQKMFL